MSDFNTAINARQFGGGREAGTDIGSTMKLTTEMTNAQIVHKTRVAVAYHGLAYRMLTPLLVNIKSYFVLCARWGKMLFIFYLFGAENFIFAQIIPSNRLPTWQGNVGVPGGIVYRTNIYKTEPAGTSASQIQTDLNNCPSNGVVLLSAGTYTFTSSLNVPSYVTLRGAGMNATIINSSANNVIQATASFADDFGSPVQANHISWISNYSQNTNVLILASTNLSGGAEAIPVGNIVMIDQQSSTNCDATGGYGDQGVWWSIGSPSEGSDRYQHEISYVKAKNGHSITIDPPIRYANYNAAALPQVWFEASSGPVKFAGVENLTLRNAGGSSTHGMGFSYAYGCWILNCCVNNFRYDVNTYLSIRCEVRHCTVGGLSGSGDDYDFSLYYNGGCWFEDNIVTNYESAFLLESCIGDAYSFNYVTNGNSTSGGNMNPGGLNSHGGNNAMNLVEGNSFVQISLDNGWGSAFGFVLLRNRIRGWDDPAATYYNYVAVIDDYSMNRFMSYVGNVLGTSGKNTVYEAQSTGNNLVYLTQLSIGGSPPNPDPVVDTSMIRAMNWDSANNGIITGGFASSDVPNSLLYTTIPAYFGNLAWPPVDPTKPAYSSSHTNIPAGYRFVFGIDPPTGSASPMAAPSPTILPALLSATPTAGKAPLTVAFNSGSQWSSNSLLDFGDGNTTTSLNPTHIYYSNWVYTVTLYNVLQATNQHVATYSNYITVTN